MAPAAALLVVPDGLGSSEWQHAIVTCSHERPTARLYVFFQVRLQALCFSLPPVRTHAPRPDRVARRRRTRPPPLFTGHTRIPSTRG
jgi:hypothetical protein